MPQVVEVESVVAAPVERVWSRVVDPEVIDHELRPWLSMRMPLGTEHLTIGTVPLGRPLGRARISLFGVLPVDHDDLTVAALEPGRSFREESTMLSARSWQHERTLAPTPAGGTHVHDRLTFEPRVPGTLAAAVHRRGVRLLFEHRHRRLAAYLAH